MSTLLDNPAFVAVMLALITAALPAILTFVNGQRNNREAEEVASHVQVQAGNNQLITNLQSDNAQLRQERDAERQARFAEERAHAITKQRLADCMEAQGGA